MKNTRFMEVLFSAVENKDEELAAQVAKDIEDAKANGSVDTDEVKYENMGDGRISVTDKENGEVTIVEKASDEEDTYDMYPAEQSEQIEGYLHPEGDGVTPGNQEGAPDEKVEQHMDGQSVISPNLPDGGLNPEAGNEKTVEETAKEGPCDENCEEKEFSVSTDNSVVLRIFSDQEFCERLFSEVIESEETVKVGDLKVEKVPEEDAVVVTSVSTGDQAKVEMDDKEMEVTELDSKNFSEEEQYNPLYVVGVEPNLHVIVDAPEYDEESAQELVKDLTEKGVEGVRIFECPNEAREYAVNLLKGLGVESDEDIEEPEQAEFSDHTIYLTKFYSENNTSFMIKLYSESVSDQISEAQCAIEDAISNGDEIETDKEIITPVDSKTAVIEDKENGEFTKVSLEGPEMELEKIEQKEAEELTDHLVVSDEEEDEEKEFSNIYCDEAQTKFFSESEEMTEYMIRLFSEESNSEDIEKAIESGEQIETDKEIITPVDSKTAVIEDKENGEFTKAEMDDEILDVNPISEDEADKLTDGLVVEDKEDDDEDEKDEEKEDEVEDENKEDEKKFSYSPILDKFFSDIVGVSPVPAGSVNPNTPVIPVAVNSDPTASEGSVESSDTTPTVESIEDKALAAVQSIRAVADEAESKILAAKEAPVQSEETDLKEAQFSEKDNSTLSIWLRGTNFKK